MRREPVPSFEEQHELDQPGSPAVAVAKGVNPRDREVRHDRQENGRRGAVEAFNAIPRAVQELAQSLEQERAVLDGRPRVTAHADRIGSDLARYNILSQGQACQDESIETLDEARGEVKRFPLNRGIEDGVAGEEQVVHFFSEVLLGLGQLQLPIDPLSYLLLCNCGR